ncbi:Zinc finger C2H2 type domain-containing protein 2 [Elsinoe fawcettii]|nr:Zinc finger C2H2 type domain-containing protein 2 [Elsinoe fawcettii]
MNTTGQSPSPGHGLPLKNPSSHSLSHDQSLPYDNLNQVPSLHQEFSNDSFDSGLDQTDPNFDLDQSAQLYHLNPSINGIGSGQLNLNHSNTSNPNDFGYHNISPQHSGLSAHGRQQANNQADYAFAFNNGNPSLDPSLLQNTNTLDPNTLSLDNMATMQGHSPTPPHLLNTNTAVSSHSPSPRHSPSPHNAQQAQFGRPRNTSESLDPSSAAFPQGYMGGDWAQGAAFTNHRRKPSDALSEYSSHSNQASPYMATMDSFDQSAHVSPMLNAQGNDAPLFNELGMMNQFSLNEPGLNPNDHISPIHSSHNSPRIPAQQQPLPHFTSTDNFGLSPDMSMQFNQNENNFNHFPNMAAFPTFQSDVVSPEGQADAMSPPEINIDFAPPSRQPSFGPRARAGSSNELAPPDAMRRKRAKSDPYSGSRSSSPGVPPSRGRSPSLQPGLNGNPQLSPAAIQLPASRSPSPAGRNRSNSAASDSRQYLLDLADPDRSTAGPGGDQKRQKHPATFQCHLCPKRFTRAYNLRSHLRTHTDERPFVCTVCGKAFARQHDRKRHEGLHSGEKKFVCKGQLKTGATWGCGRRFARADALGRHFRSEAGRECIKPLLDEEAEERRKTWMEEQRQQQLQSQQGFIAPNPLTEMPVAPQLPAVLLQMYPDLAGFDFGAPLGNMGVVDEGDYGGRSSFDASGGSEFEMSDNDIGYDTGAMNMGHQNFAQPNNWG